MCWQQIVLGGLDRGREGMEVSGGIVCWQQIVLGGLDRGREGMEVSGGIVCWQKIVLGELDIGGKGRKGWAGSKGVEKKVGKGRGVK